MAFDKEKIQKAIETAIVEGEFAPAVRHDIAFHMTDWLSELEDWHAFCSEPEALNSDAVEKLLMNFLIHVPNHVAAARKLFLGFPMEDIFEVGIFDEEE